MHRSIFLSLASLLVSCAPALADPFIDDRTGVADEYFHNSFADHNSALDSGASRMRGDSDYSSLSQSHGHLSQGQANQISTWQTSQDLFSNTQMEALLSGGIRHSNGSNGSSALYGSGGGYGYGYGYGGFGGSSQVSPDNWGSEGNTSGGNFYGSGSSSLSGGW